jgi:uncharacterized phage protein gp47/JayE
MADFLTPSEIGDNYLTYLQSLKPSVNVSQTDSDWYIRSRVNGGVVAGIYADQMLISNDAFPQSARHEALGQFLELYLQRTFLSPTVAQGFLGVTGTIGLTLPQGLQAVYQPNGNAYFLQSAFTFTSTTGAVPLQSAASGQAQNLLDGAILNFPSPPAGLNAVGIVSGGLSDARDAETDLEASSAVITRIQSTPSVGRITDYQFYALQADPSVVSASIQRYVFGLGTVGVYITSGTTNIDEAIDNGQAINVIPSPQLLATVQAFLNINRPITDCVYVFAPNTIVQDVNVVCVFAQGDANTILTGQTLTQGQLVQREVNRALYKTPVGGFQLNSSGYVVASYVEETIDAMLSNQSVVVGSIPILLDRRVAPLTASGFNRLMLVHEVVTPGNITITEET